MRSVKHPVGNPKITIGAYVPSKKIPRIISNKVWNGVRVVAGIQIGTVRRFINDWIISDKE
jgi:hypothetical protein